MPFYEAFARSGQIDRANEIGSVIRETPNFVNPYCDNLELDNFDFENTIDEYLVLNLCPNLGE